MKLPAAAGPSTRFPMAAGAFGAVVTGGGELASGEVAASLAELSGLPDFAFADGAGVSCVRDADRDGTVWEATDGAAGTDAGEVGGGGNGDELQPLNAATVPNNPIHIRERNATDMIHDLDE